MSDKKPIGGESIIASLLDKASEVMGFFDGGHEKGKPLCDEVTRAGRSCQGFLSHEGEHWHEDDSLGSLDDERRAERETIEAEFTPKSDEKPKEKPVEKKYDDKGYPIGKKTQPVLPPFDQITAVMDGDHPILFGPDRAGGVWSLVNGEWSPVPRILRD